MDKNDDLNLCASFGGYSLSIVGEIRVYVLGSQCDMLASVSWCPDRSGEEFITEMVVIFLFSCLELHELSNSCDQLAT